MRNSRGEPCPWGVTRGQEIDDSPQPLVYLVEDGERHWVVALSPDDAERQVANTHDCSLEDYREETTPKTTLWPADKLIRIVLELDITPRDLPPHTTVVAEIKPSEAAKHYKGVFCSTAW